MRTTNHTLSPERERIAEAIRERYRRKAYRHECATGRAPEFVKAATTLSDVLPFTSGIEGSEAIAAASEVRDALDPLTAYRQITKDMDDAALNYSLANLCYDYWALKYFKSFFYRKLSEAYHYEIFDILRAVETHSITRPAAVAGPRDWGKSMMGCVLMPIHCIVFPVYLYYPDREVDISKKFIGLISIVEGSSTRHLETICRELEDNEEIRADFGEFYRDPDAGKRKVGGRQDPWSRKVAVTLNSKRIEAFGRKGKVRGAMWRGVRLDCPIGDDVEDDENAESVTRQDRDFKWLTQTVANCPPKENGNMLLLGNLVNPNGLMDRCVKFGRDHGWRVKVFQLYTIDEETQEKVYTWPEEFGAEYEKEKRDITDDAGFEAEFQQNPDAHLRDLKKEDISYYTLADIQPRLREMLTFSAIDPAASVTPRSDFTAIDSIADDISTGTIYVLPCVIERMPTSKHAEKVVEVQSLWGATRFGIETVQYQVALKDAVEAEVTKSGVHIEIVPIPGNTRTNKKRRIAARLIPRVKAGKIKFLRDDDSHKTIIDQLLRLASTLYDDGVDALEMAVAVRDAYYQELRKPKGGVRARVLTVKSRPRVRLATVR